MIIYILFVILAAILSWIAISKSKELYRVVSVCCLIAFTTIGPITYLETLSKPKKINEEYLRSDEKVEVLAYKTIPGEGLYLWMGIPNVKEPRYYKMDWNEQTRKMAQELQDGFENKQRMMMVLPFEKSLEKEKQVYPIPQLKLPDKPEEKQQKRNIPSYGI